LDFYFSHAMALPEEAGRGRVKTNYTVFKKLPRYPLISLTTSKGWLKW
jgi:hypothetical protein